MRKERKRQRKRRGKKVRRGKIDGTREGISLLFDKRVVGWKGESMIGIEGGKVWKEW